MKDDEVIDRMGVEKHAPTDLVTPAKIAAEQIAECMELDLSCTTTKENPDYNEKSPSKDEPKHISRNQYMGKLTSRGWVVARIMCYGNSPTNFGHEPAVLHRTVALLVRLKAS